MMPVVRARYEENIESLMMPIVNSDFFDALRQHAGSAQRAA